MSNQFEKHAAPFFLQGLGFGALYWAVSKQRNGCSTGQSPGNEMTALQVNLRATGGAVANQAMLFKRGRGFGR